MNIGLNIMRLLVLLVNDGILGSASTCTDLGIVVLGNLLVGLLGSLGTSALNSLGNVVNGVLCYILVIQTTCSVRESRTLAVSMVNKRFE